MKATAHRVLAMVGTALAGVALLACGAQAAERPDDRGGLIGVGGAQAIGGSPVPTYARTAYGSRVPLRSSTGAGSAPPSYALNAYGTRTPSSGVVLPAPPDAFERAVLRSAAANRVPDLFERAVLREGRSAARPDDRAGGRGPGNLASTLSSVAVSSTDEGFRWDDAFLGAAAMLAVVLLGAAATLTIRRRGGVALR